MYRAEKINPLIRNEQRPHLPGTRYVFVTSHEAVSHLGLLRSQVKELPPTTRPNPVCTRRFLNSCRGIGQMFADKASIVSVPSRREGLSNNGAYKRQILRR
jgi:hypothetical protein